MRGGMRDGQAMAMEAPAALPLRTRIVRWLMAGSWTMVALLAVLTAASLIGNHAADAWALDLQDPDNYIRLAQIRDWLGGQSWFDVTQYRIDPPGGMHTHWSRIADLPAGVAIWLLTPLTGVALAERLALTVTPLLLLVVAFVLIVRIADALAGRAARFPTAIVALYAVKSHWEFVPGRIDHHALQIVLVLGMITALVTGDRRRNGALAALAAALSIGVGMETAPYVAAGAAWVALRWGLRGESARDLTLGFMGGLAVLVPLVFALTVPVADWGLAKGDAIGRGHVAGAVLIGGALAIAAAVGRGGRRARLLAVLAIGAIGGGIVLGRFPEVTSAPYAMVGPLLLRLWIANIAETRSVVQDWATSPAVAVARLAFGVAMVGVGAALSWRAEGAARDRYLLLSVIAVVGIVLSGWQFRSIALGAAVALPLAGAGLAALFARSIGAAALGIAAVAALLLADVVVPQEAANTPALADEACLAHGNWADIGKLPPGLVLGQINLAGPFLVWTPHSVLSSGLHRGYPGIRFSFETWMAAPDAARAAASARGVRYVAECATGGETKTLAREAPHSLAAALYRGQVPGWLIPVPHGGNPALKLYRLVPPAAP